MTTLPEIYWQISKDGSKLSRSEFLSHLQYFDLMPIMVSNEIAGCIALRDNEIHVGVKPEYRRRWSGKWFYKLLDDLIDSYGSVITYVFDDQVIAVDFVKRLGFEIVCSTGGISTMERRRKR